MGVRIFRKITVGNKIILYKLDNVWLGYLLSIPDRITKQTATPKIGDGSGWDTYLP